MLLELSDLELECGLGITHPMHRKKLRLAIEEHRHPALVRYPCIAQLGHTWVSSEWLPDLGLSQVCLFCLVSIGNFQTRPYSIPKASHQTWSMLGCWNI